MINSLQQGFSFVDIRSVGLSFTPTQHNLLECLAKVRVEYGVNHRVDQRVAPPEPSGGVEGLGQGDIAGARAQRKQVHDEKWQPATDEGCHDDGQHDGRLLLFRDGADDGVGAK